MADEKKVEIKPAKGRPMLTWVGKRPLRRVTAFPAQQIETFAPDVPAPVREAGPCEGGTWTDWPGADYMRKVSLRGPKGTAKLDGESYTLGEQIQYTDIWANDNVERTRWTFLRSTIRSSIGLEK